MAKNRQKRVQIDLFQTEIDRLKVAETPLCSVTRRETIMKLLSLFEALSWEKGFVKVINKDGVFIIERLPLTETKTTQ